MSFVSQLTIIIINYISILGLLICGLLSLFLTNKKKKLLFLFLSFLFVGALNFVYYSDILFFIAGIIMLFFFVLLYLFVLQMDFFGRWTPQETGEKIKGSVRSRALNIIIPLFCSAAIGYFIYKCVSGFLKEVEIAEDSGNIFIADWSDISKIFFTDYSLALVIITASLFISFLWFIAVKERGK